MNRLRKVSRQHPTRNHCQRRLRHHEVFENEISVFGLNVENRVGYLVKRMISEDEKIAAEGHRRRVTRQRQYRVVHAVPIANEGIDKNEHEDQADNSWYTPPEPRSPEREHWIGSLSCRRA